MRRTGPANPVDGLLLLLATPAQRAALKRLAVEERRTAHKPRPMTAEVLGTPDKATTEGGAQ